jgi:hypothetical protein
MPAVETDSRSGEAASYRREAAEIRAILDSIRDEQFRDQLLEIANQYEAVAAAIEKVRSLEELWQDAPADRSHSTAVRSCGDTHRLKTGD